MDKVAVVTGTSSGLGEGIAKALLELGWKVYGASRRGNAKLGREVRYVEYKGDLTDMKQVNNFVSQISENTIDLLVNNAGIVVMEDAANWKPETFEKTFAINYVTPIQLLNALKTKLHNGLVITTLSDSTHLGWEGFGVYGSSKAALWLHMKSFCAENRDISVVNIHPGAFDSPIIDSTTQEMIDERDEMMTIKDVVTVVEQIVTGVMNFPSGSSIFLHNEWEAEEFQLLHKDEYLYNVDTEIVTQIKTNVV